MKPNRKLKKQYSPPKLVLGHVVGLTTKNANGFDSNESSSNCVYTAGCVLVVYDVVLGSQSSFMVPNRIPKPLSCTAMSKDGRFVAAGESGDHAAVLVWDCTSSALLSELKSHRHGVECIAFSPDGNFIVSIGLPSDGYICLWDSRSGILVARLKACASCSSVESVCFSSDSNFIVTAGKKHLKIWRITSPARTRANFGVKSMSLHGKPMNLGNQKGCSFIAVKSPTLPHNNLDTFGQTCETLTIYGLTDSGVLCAISGSSIRKFVDVKVKKVFALTVSNKTIACACSNGVVKLFTTESLDYSGSLRHNDWRKSEEDDNDSHGESHKNDLKLLAPLPHAIACEFSTSEKLVVLYGDNSIYTWDICDLQKVTSRQVLVSHSGCICDIKCIPCKNMHGQSLAYSSRSSSDGTSFATCSEDGIIRLWNLSQAVSSVSDQTLVTKSNSILTKPVKPIYIVNSEIFEPESEKVGVRAPGFCSMAISSDGKYLAVSDMAIDPTTEVVVTVGQDKKLNIFSTDTGRFIRSFKQGGDFGDVIKVTVDQSSSFLACSYSNRSICIYELLTGEIAARAVGHGEVITGLIFLPDFQHIVSVSGDGCIFIWRLPTFLSSKMLQKSEENSRSLSQRNNLQPQIEYYEDAHEFEINPKEVKQIESSTPAIHRFSCQGVGLHEMSVFKFSISRLPKWAQARAIAPVGDLAYEPSQQIGHSSSVGRQDCSILQTPSKNEQDSGELFLDSISAFSSDTSTCQGFRLPDEVHRTSFALDGRWLTIHTVCLDLLTSPGVCDTKVMVNAPKMPDQAPSEAMERFKQPMVEISSSNIKLRGTDKVNRNLSNVSAQSETEKMNSSARRSFLTRIALRNDHRGQKNLNHPPIMIPTGEDMVQDLHTLVPNSFMSQGKLADYSTLNRGKCEEQSTIIACKEAFLNMENAVDNAFHLFSKLRNLAIRDDLRDSESGLYSQVAEIIPSLAMKFHAVTQMAQPRGKTENDI